RTELEEINQALGKGDKRRTLIASIENEREISAEDLIVAEDNHVLVTRDGWIKRQKEIKDPSASRLREGDQVLACIAGSTRATVVFFSSLGTAYTCRFIDVPATSGYGEPIQKLFKLKDGEAIVAAYSMDPRLIGDVSEREGKLPKRYAVGATSDGNALAFGLSSFIEPSTRAGRRFAKLSEGATVVGVYLIRGKETLIVASHEKKGLLCHANEVSYLSGAGKGVSLIKLEDDDRVVGFAVAYNSDDALVLRTSLGGEQRISPSKHSLSSRGGKGNDIIKRGQFVEVILPTVAAPTLPEG
ncbi:MAG TPA: DNA gyrase C-terminal beta-propeller domain-containing protein, partial [Polyangiaceae bacterium]